MENSDKQLYHFTLAQMLDVVNLFITLYPREVINELIKTNEES